MKKILYILGLVAATCCYAQEQMPQMTDDYCFGFLPGYPDHYCECRNTSTPFSYPLQVTTSLIVGFGKKRCKEEHICKYETEEKDIQASDSRERIPARPARRRQTGTQRADLET